MSRGVRHTGPGRRLVAAAVVLLLLSAGCGSTTPPAQEVPELDSALSQVDRAIVGHRPVQARRQLRQLIRTTVEARDAGRLDSAQADDVLAAAAGLLAALPRPRPRPEPAPTTPLPPPEPEPRTAAPHGDHEGHGHGGENGNQDEGNRDHGGQSDEGD